VHEELAAWHEEFDRRERLGRVQRTAAVLRWLEPYDEGLSAGGEEARLALSEAKDAYIYGLPLASLFSSHVACERMLAGLFGLLPDDAAPKGWEKWGLGRLVPAARERGWLGTELTSDLLVLCDTRKVTGHFRRPTARGTLDWRIAEMLPFEDDAENLVGLLLKDAAQGLRAAFRLAYSPEEGLRRVLD
jgi:hypothetical protein